MSHTPFRVVPAQVSDIMYRCLSCGKDVELDLASGKKVICPFCGYRIMRKTRPVAINKVQAR